MSEKSNILEKEFKCKRCGICCKLFSSQIRYCIEPKEVNWDKIHPYYKNIINEFNNKSDKNSNFIYRINRYDFYLNPTRKYLFLPTKLEYLISILRESYKKGKKIDVSNLFKLLTKYSSSKSADECVFLTLKNGLATCTINDTHPKMCDNYPKGKGYVCNNQPERHFTKTYLNFKKNKFKEVIEILRQVVPYFSEHNLEKSFEIVVFLMDFGFFEYTKVEEFFLTIGWELIDFKYAIKDLLRYGLVFDYYKEGIRTLESISSTSLKNQLKNIFS